MNERAKSDQGDEFVIALEPAQIGALIALAIAVLVIWRVVRRSE